ncbi:MAG TPA: SRPBCC family protein [Rugosimonospora sp.]|nr:SRPBCC family protein [Rugosimonospora sp.]
MAEEYGLLDEVGGRWRLRFARRLPHPPEKVWRALTEPEHLSAWFPTTIEGERAAGAPLRFTFPDGAAEPFDGQMLAYDPPSLLEFHWGPDTLRFELVPDGDGSLLTLLDLLAEQGKAARDGAGWHLCLRALERHLDEGGEPRDLGAWKPLNDEYVQRFGPEAATIGPPEGMTVE